MKRRPVALFKVLIGHRFRLLLRFHLFTNVYALPTSVLSHRSFHHLQWSGAPSMRRQLTSSYDIVAEHLLRSIPEFWDPPRSWHCWATQSMILRQKRLHASTRLLVKPTASSVRYPRKYPWETGSSSISSMTSGFANTLNLIANRDETGYPNLRGESIITSLFYSRTSKVSSVLACLWHVNLTTYTF